MISRIFFCILEARACLAFIVLGYLIDKKHD